MCRPAEQHETGRNSEAAKALHQPTMQWQYFTGYWSRRYQRQYCGDRYRRPWFCRHTHQLSPKCIAGASGIITKPGTKMAGKQCFTAVVLPPCIWKQQLMPKHWIKIRAIIWQSPLVILKTVPSCKPWRIDKIGAGLTRGIGYCTDRRRCHIR